MTTSCIHLFPFLLVVHLFATANSHSIVSSFISTHKLLSHIRVTSKRHNVPQRLENVPTSFLTDLYHQALTFRVVVIGDGAIMESTHTLGNPHMFMHSSTSPKTGDPIITFASPDKSFEFHVKVKEIESVQFVERQDMKICRLIKSNTVAVCSLILKDDSKEATAWFTEMKNKYSSLS